MVSGSQVKPGAIPLKVTTNSNDAPPGSPKLASLQGAPSQPAEVHEPRPSAISEGVLGPTHMALDHPITLPARVPSSKPPTLPGWFPKSFSSSLALLQQPLLDRSIPPSPTPSLRVIEVPPTSSSAVPVQRRSQ